MQKITINVPDDCEVQIVKKEEKKEPVKTYQDLIDSKAKARGYFINLISEIEYKYSPYSVVNTNIAASKKVAKSMLAMAVISQLMPYYGGEITEEEWKRDHYKYIIKRCRNKIEVDYYSSIYNFLAFHTAEQRDEFLKYNEQLVKDYLMID